MFLSVVLQVFLFLSFFNFFSGLYFAYSEISTGDPKLLAGHISSGIVLSIIQIIPALIGLLLSVWLVKRHNKFKLFINCSRYFAYLWLLFIPIGTFLGVNQLKRLKNT
jgi:hypothetical protein